MKFADPSSHGFETRLSEYARSELMGQVRTGVWVPLQPISKTLVPDDVPALGQSNGSTAGSLEGFRLVEGLSADHSFYVVCGYNIFLIVCLQIIEVTAECWGVVAE